MLMSQRVLVGNDVSLLGEEVHESLHNGFWFLRWVAYCLRLIAAQSRNVPHVAQANFRVEPTFVLFDVRESVLVRQVGFLKLRKEAVSFGFGGPPRLPYPKRNP